MNNKYTYLFGLVEAINCNPNGDPNDSNFPRLAPFNGNYKLEISPYAIKRKMRNAWSDAGYNVILNESSRGETIKSAYANAFKEFGVKAKEKGDEVNLEKLTDEIVMKYTDVVFGIYRDMKVTGLKDELFTFIKKQQLVISESKSLNSVGHKLDSFKKTLTSHYISDQTKQGGGMGSYNVVDYALFPIVMNSQVEYKNSDVILQGFVDGFNHNLTATKNFNVLSGLIITSDIPLKKSFVNVINPDVDGDKLELVLSEKAKGIKVSGREYIEGKGYNDFLDKDLYSVLKQYVDLYNNK